MKAKHLGVVTSLILSSCHAWGAEPISNTSIVASKLFFDKSCAQTSDKDADSVLPKQGQELAPLVATLISAIAPNIVDKLTGFVSGYFKKRAEEYSSTDTVKAPLTIAPASQDQLKLGCMMYVSGEFGAAPQQAKNWNLQQMDLFGLSKPPKVYAEWVVHYADASHKLVTLSPVYLEFESALSPRTSSGGKKDLSFVIQLNDPLSSAKPAAVSDTSVLPNAVPGAASATVSAQEAKSKGKATGKPAASTATEGVSNGSQKAEDLSSSQSSVGQSVALFAFHYPKIAQGSQLRLRALKGMSAPAQSLRFSKNTVLNAQITEVETENGGDFMLQLSQFVVDTKPAVDPILVDALKKAVGQGSTTTTASSSK